MALSAFGGGVALNVFGGGVALNAFGGGVALDAFGGARYVQLTRICFYNFCHG